MDYDGFVTSSVTRPDWVVDGLSHTRSGALAHTEKKRCQENEARDDHSISYFFLLSILHVLNSCSRVDMDITQFNKNKQ